MKKRAITLVELIITVCLLVIVILAMSVYQDWAMQQAYTDKRQARAVNDGTYALLHLQKEIMNSQSVDLAPPLNGTISAAIRLVPSNNRYALSGSDLYFYPTAGPAELLAQNISSVVFRDGSTAAATNKIKLLSVKITFKDSQDVFREFPMERKILARLAMPVGAAILPVCNMNLCGRLGVFPGNLACSYNTITSALINAGFVSGDEIHCVGAGIVLAGIPFPGTLNENIWITDSVTLVGSCDGAYANPDMALHPITIDGGGGLRVFRITELGGGPPINDVTIESFRIENAQGGITPIAATINNSLTIRNNRMTNLDAGISLRTLTVCPLVTVDGNQIINNRKAGVTIGFTGNVNFTNNIIDGNGVLPTLPAECDSGVVIASAAAGGTVTFTGDSISNNAVNGVWLANHPYNLSFTNVTISGNGQEGVYSTGAVQTNNVSFTQCTINNNGATGAVLRGVLGILTFDWNTIDGNGFNGIFTRSPSLRISNNWIANNASNGVSVAGSAISPYSFLSRNNTIIGNSDKGIYAGTKVVSVIVNDTIALNGNEGVELFGSSDSEIRNSILWANGGVEIALTGFPVPAVNVEYSDVDGGWAGLGNINSDPLYGPPGPDGIAGNGDDFQLPAISPCINVGDPAIVFNDVDATRNDMGAWGGPIPGAP